MASRVFLAICTSEKFAVLWFPEGRRGLFSAELMKKMRSPVALVDQQHVEDLPVDVGVDEAAFVEDVLDVAGLGADAVADGVVALAAGPLDLLPDALLDGFVFVGVDDAAEGAAGVLLELFEGRAVEELMSSRLAKRISSLPVAL